MLGEGIKLFATLQNSQSGVRYEKYALQLALFLLRGGADGLDGLFLSNARKKSVTNCILELNSGNKINSYFSVKCLLEEFLFILYPLSLNESQMGIWTFFVLSNCEVGGSLKHEGRMSTATAILRFLIRGLVLLRIKDIADLEAIPLLEFIKEGVNTPFGILVLLGGQFKLRRKVTSLRPLVSPEITGTRLNYLKLTVIKTGQVVTVECISRTVSSLAHAARILLNELVFVSEVDRNVLFEILLKTPPNMRDETELYWIGSELKPNSGVSVYERYMNLTKCQRYAVFCCSVFWFLQ